MLRNIPNQYLRNIYEMVRQVSPLGSSPRLVANAVACAGASTCQLGICLSRGALSATLDQLKDSDLDLDELNDFRLYFSGCLNSCGRHGLAHLGFFGKAGRKEGHSYPAYIIVAGMKIDAVNGSTLAHKIDEISAHDVPRFVEEFLREYLSRKNAFASFSEYLTQEGEDRIHTLCDRYRDIPTLEEDASYYRDWGAPEPFSLAGRGTGECAAGLFDLIEVDLEKIRADRVALDTENDPAARSILLHRLVVTTARALLITRGIKAATNEEVLHHFERQFVDTGIVAENLRSVLQAARRGPAALTGLREPVLALTREVEDLYASMDDSLQLHPAARSGESPQETVAAIDLVKDLRGVACPMNFVKTKMALSQLTTGQVLQVLLDDGEPIDNVPKSVEAEGHRIIGQIKTADHWSVTIRKA